jgi:KDO2-lipid IV(A) lauroyltransferase
MFDPGCFRNCSGGTDGLGRRIPLRGLRHALAVPALKAAIAMAVVSPRWLLWKLAGLLGLLASLLPVRSNRIVRRHRESVMEPLGMRARTRDIYRYVLGGVLDFLHLSRRSDRQFGEVVRTRGGSNLTGALQQGRGAVVITAHYGAWELIPRATVLMGCRTAVVGRRLWQSGPDRILTGLRREPGVTVLDRSEGIMPIVRQLRRNTAIGILIDQDTGAVQTDYVEFLGRPARTPTGPAGIAIRMGVPVVPLHIRRMPDSTYLLRIEEPIDPSDYGGESAAADLTRELNRRIRGWIAEDPRQWVWFHRRFKKTPGFDYPR